MIEIKNNIIRGVEKIPGINLLQILKINDKNFLMFPKTGTRTIRDTFLTQHNLSKNSDAWSHINYISKNSFQTIFNNPKTLIPLRHPLDRLHSCWKQKISSQRDKGLFYFFQYYPMIRPEMSFLDFMKVLETLPQFIFEKHFIPLSYFLSNDAHHKYSFFDIKLLNQKLSNETGIEKINKSNSTQILVPSDTETNFYEDNLKHVYRGDEDLFTQYKYDKQ